MVRKRTLKKIITVFLLNSTLKNHFEIQKREPILNAIISSKVD